MMFSQWQGWALGSAAFAAAAGVTAKLGLRGMDSDHVTLLRTMVMLPLLSLAVWAMHKWPPASVFSARAMGWIILSGAAGAASWLCFFRALKLGEVGPVAAIDKLSVLLAAVLAAMLLGERMGVPQWLGAGLMTVGAMLVVTR